MDEMAPAKFTIKELERRLRAEFPEMFHTRSGYALEQLWHGGCRVRKHFHPRSLRPGGTLSGPTMMASPISEYTSPSWRRSAGCRPR